MIVASDYRHTVSITLQTQTGTGDRGQDVYSTTTIGTVPAKIEPLAGRKQEIARQIVPTATHEVTIRYLAGVTPNCKVVFGSRTFNIGNVNNIKENNYHLVLTCVEVQ
jgi:SPP1 family predicted phage head-tail adaptor